MSKQQLIKLVTDHLPRLCDQTYCEQRNDDEDRWFEISDSSVNKIRKENVLRKQAYLLFYDRIAWITVLQVKTSTVLRIFSIVGCLYPR